eukprot:14047183-Heterocapsa_arctica.AAC.1
MPMVKGKKEKEVEKKMSKIGMEMFLMAFIMAAEKAARERAQQVRGRWARKAPGEGQREDQAEVGAEARGQEAQDNGGREEMAGEARGLEAQYR